MNHWKSTLILTLVVLACSCVDARAAQKVKAVKMESPQKAIPIEYLAHLTVVEALINGSGPYRVVLDTGAGVTVLDDDLVESLNIPAVGTSEIGSPMGSEPITADSLQVDSVTLGDVTVENTPAVSMDLQKVFGALDAPDAILAAASFDGSLITIDYPNNVVLIRQGQLPPADGRRVLEYSARSVVPNVSISIAGEQVEVAIDTGAPSNLVMPVDYIAKLPLESEPTVVGQGRTVDATFEILSSKLGGTVRIGDIVLENPDVTFSEPAKHPHVGMGVLRQYAVTIDSANRRIMFELPETTAETPAPTRRVVRGGGARTYGIMLNGLSGDVLEVRGVEQGLPAAGAGLEAGDRIVAINGKPVESLGGDERVRHLRGSPLVLTVERNGEVIEISMSLD